MQMALLYDFLKPTNTESGNEERAQFFNSKKWIQFKQKRLGPTEVKFDNLFIIELKEDLSQLSRMTMVDDKKKQLLHRIPFYEVFKCIDQNLTNYYNQFRNTKEEDIPDDVKSFFYFTKNKENGCITYHLFPKLDLKLIENPELM